MTDSFLTADDISTLTGIKKGRGGKTREQLQHSILLEMGIPSRVNARGMPIVTWSMVNGQQPAANQSQHKWTPAALRKTA